MKTQFLEIQLKEVLHSGHLFRQFLTWTSILNIHLETSTLNIQTWNISGCSKRMFKLKSVVHFQYLFLPVRKSLLHFESTKNYHASSNSRKWGWWKSSTIIEKKFSWLAVTCSSRNWRSSRLCAHRLEVAIFPLLTCIPQKASPLVPHLSLIFFSLRNCSSKFHQWFWCILRSLWSVFRNKLHLCIEFI